MPEGSEQGPFVMEEKHGLADSLVTAARQTHAFAVSVQEFVLNFDCGGTTACMYMPPSHIFDIPSPPKNQADGGIFRAFR
jgi:hypothetical protein